MFMSENWANMQMNILNGIIIMMITTRLIKQGFRYNKLVGSFKKFYVKYIHRYNVGLKRHVYEGICGLYIGRPSLYRHVTTRRRRL